MFWKFITRENSDGDDNVLEIHEWMEITAPNRTKRVQETLTVESQNELISPKMSTITLRKAFRKF